MKTIIKKSRFGKSIKIPAALSLLVLFLMIAAGGCGGGKPDMPSESATQALVKSSLKDFADAVEKGDFKTFRENASKDFQSQFKEEQLKTTFTPFIEKKEVAVPILRSAAGMNAKFSAPPAIREESGNYILVANGNFDTTPAKTRFTNEYVWRDGAWKLLKIGTYLE